MEHRLYTECIKTPCEKDKSFEKSFLENGDKFLKNYGENFPLNDESVRKMVEWIDEYIAILEEVVQKINDEKNNIKFDNIGEDVWKNLRTLQEIQDLIVLLDDLRNKVDQDKSCIFQAVRTLNNTLQLYGFTFRNSFKEKLQDLKDEEEQRKEIEKHKDEPVARIAWNDRKESKLIVRPYMVFSERTPVTQCYKALCEFVDVQINFYCFIAYKTEGERKKYLELCSSNEADILENCIKKRETAEMYIQIHFPEIQCAEITKKIGQLAKEVYKEAVSNNNKTALKYIEEHRNVIHSRINQYFVQLLKTLPPLVPSKNTSIMNSEVYREAEKSFDKMMHTIMSGMNKAETIDMEKKEKEEG